MRLKVLFLLGILMAATAAIAQTGATGYITWTQSGNVYDYDITLQNTGTTNIGTLWYAWLPGYDFLFSAPSATSGPTGWNGGVLTHGGPNDGYGVQWIAATPIPPGQSLSGFHFSSTDTPAMLASNSHYYPTIPVGTAEVYEGGPFSGGHVVFVINPQPATVPPSAFTLFRGRLISGSLSSLLNVDQSYLNVQPGLTLNPSEAPVQMILNGTSPLGTIGDLKIDVTGHADTPGLTQTIELFDWTANAYVLVDSRGASQSDSLIEITAGSPQRFVQSGTNALRARIALRATGPVTHFPWNVFFDQTVWRVSP